MLPAEQIQAILSGYTGSELIYRHSWCRNLVYTEGIRALCEAAHCYWLIDAITSHQRTCLRDAKGMLQDMQFWKLKVDAKQSTAVLTCERDTDDIAIRQEIPYTDFPLEKVNLWVSKSAKHFVLMLPSEY